MHTLNIPTPCKEQLNRYLSQLKSDEKFQHYHFQGLALEKLFKLYPKNSDILSILLKVSTLNDFYSTNIFSTYSVAKQIESLNIDKRLEEGDEILVADIQKVTIRNKQRNFYSFATKYCSHHKPDNYPIYDSYVDRVLRYFRKKDKFYSFYSDDLKNYPKFKQILVKFQQHYGIECSVRDLDRYLWLLGKEHFNKHKETP